MILWYFVCQVTFVILLVAFQTYSKIQQTIMDSEDGILIKPEADLSSTETSKSQTVVVPDNKQEKKQDVQANEPVDVMNQLVNNKNPLPLLAVIDQVDLFSKTQDGVPLFNLLMNKFLPLQDILGEGKIKFQADADGKTPLHYAVEVDDVKTVYWLLRKGAPNAADKFGNTPVMDSVRLGFRRSFLLFMHYQHINQTIPHVAAQYNRVWELRAMQALGLNISLQNQKSRTPLEIAVQNYSYEAAEYLATVTDNYNIKKLKYLTDSEALMRRVKKGKQKSSVQFRAIRPLLSKTIIFIILLLVAIANQYYQSTKFHHLVHLATYGLLFILIFVVGWIMGPKRRDLESIMHLLRQPDFPTNTDHICPSCINKYNHLKQDHCDICHTCVPKFHQHHYVCINKSNQLIWFATEYFYLYTLVCFLREGVSSCIDSISGKVPSESFWGDFVNTIYYNTYMTYNYISAAFFIFLLAITVRQALFCLQLFGMAFMNRTYQQVTRSQDYPYLYSVFKNKAGKMKTKQIRIFQQWKLLGGLCVGIRNIVLYFC